MLFDASTLTSDSRLAFLHGQYEVSLMLAKEALTIDEGNPDVILYKKSIQSYSE